MARQVSLPDEFNTRRPGETTRQYVARIAAAFDAPERREEYRSHWCDDLNPLRGNVPMWAMYVRRDVAQAIINNEPEENWQTIEPLSSPINKINTTINTTSAERDNTTYRATETGIKLEIIPRSLSNAQLRHIANAVRDCLHIKVLEIRLPTSVDFVGMCILLDLAYARPDLGIICDTGLSREHTADFPTWEITNQITGRYVSLYDLRAELQNSLLQTYNERARQVALDENLDIGDIASPRARVGALRESSEIVMRPARRTQTPAANITTSQNTTNTLIRVLGANSRSGQMGLIPHPVIWWSTSAGFFGAGLICTLVGVGIGSPMAVLVGCAVMDVSALTLATTLTLSNNEGPLKGTAKTLIPFYRDYSTAAGLNCLSFIIFAGVSYLAFTCVSAPAELLLATQVLATLAPVTVYFALSALSGMRDSNNYIKDHSCI